LLFPAHITRCTSLTVCPFSYISFTFMNGLCKCCLPVRAFTPATAAAAAAAAASSFLPRSFLFLQQQCSRRGSILTEPVNPLQLREGRSPRGREVAGQREDMVRIVSTRRRSMNVDNRDSTAVVVRIQARGTGVRRASVGKLYPSAYIYKPSPYTCYRHLITGMENIRVHSVTGSIPERLITIIITQCAMTPIATGNNHPLLTVLLRAYK